MTNVSDVYSNVQSINSLITEMSKRTSTCETNTKQ